MKVSHFLIAIMERESLNAQPETDEETNWKEEPEPKEWSENEDAVFLMDYERWFEDGLSELGLKKDLIEFLENRDEYQHLQQKLGVEFVGSFGKFINNFYISLRKPLHFLDQILNPTIKEKKETMTNFKAVEHVDILLGFLKYMLVPVSMQANLATLEAAEETWDQRLYPTGVTKISLFTQEAIKLYAYVWGCENPKLVSKVQAAIRSYEKEDSQKGSVSSTVTTDSTDGGEKA